MFIRGFLVLGLTGCAGIYGEIAATRLSGTVDSGGTEVDVKTMALGFNVGVEFGNHSRRFAAGYMHEQQSYDMGDGSFDGAAFRYDFNIKSLTASTRAKPAATTRRARPAWSVGSARRSCCHGTAPFT